MTVVIGNPLLTEEFDSIDLFVTTQESDTPAKNKIFFSASFFEYSSLLSFQRGYKFGILGNEPLIGIIRGLYIGVPEIYEFFKDSGVQIIVAFDICQMIQKYLYRKSQLWIGSQISGIPVASILSLRNSTQNLIYTPDTSNNKNRGIYSESCSSLYYELSPNNSERPQDSVEKLKKIDL